MLAWAEELGAEATTVTELLEEDNEEVHILFLEKVHLRFIFLQVKLEIMAQIQKVNRKAISNAQKVNDSCSALDFHTCTFFQVHKFMIAPKDFSLPGGELTPTMKLKRHTVMEMYEKKIQQVSAMTLFNFIIQFFSPCADVRARDPELHVVTIFSHAIPFPSRESSSHQHRSPCLLSYQQQS